MRLKPVFGFWVIAELIKADANQQPTALPNVGHHSTGFIFLINKNAINADKAANIAQIRITFT